jgi:2,4-dienoyl-CoA reductase-like NADH-dependent reductase (Old Yellow Enzyme family)
LATSISLTPITLGGVTVKNRIYRPPHQMHMCEMGRVTERFIAYHEARAAGGTGLIILEAAPVHHKSGTSPRVLHVWDDGAVEGVAKLAERLSSHGARVFIQLLHGGMHGFPWDGSPPWAPSAGLQGYMMAGPAVEMTKGMINEVIESYVAAARRMVAAGLHGVEVHAAHGYLPQQFLGEATNRRTDEYGGSFENRSRFLMETMRALRAALPADFALGARVGPELDVGLPGMAENERVMVALEQEDLVDFFDTSVGDAIRGEFTAASLSRPAGYQLPYLENVASRIRTPVLVTGRFRTIAEADEVIRSGQGAMVGMVRAQIADPEIVRKTVEGRMAEIRPCIGCNQRCAGGVPYGDVGCAVNPGAGRELMIGDDKLAPAATPKRVVVVGGGVAGMEAARVAALRGHRVVLHETLPELGGEVRYVARRAPKMGDFGDIAVWQVAELRRLGVEIHTGSQVEAADLVADPAEVVVVATGSRPRMDGLQQHRPGHVVAGADLPHVISAHDVLSAPAERLGRTALVLDDLGHYEAVAAAEHLIEAGLAVTYVTRHASFAPLLDMAFRSTPAYERMSLTGRFRFRGRALLDRIEQGRATIFDPSIDSGPEVVPADTVVLVGYNLSRNELASALAGSGKQVVCVGGALSPRFLEHAIGDGFRVGAEI